MSDWYPFFLVAGGGTVWTVLCILVAQRYEKHDGPLSLAIVPVLLGFFILVVSAEALW